MRPLRTILLALSALSALTALPRPAAAQFESPRMIRFGLGGGVTVPVNHVKDTLKQGYVLQGVLSLTLPGSPFALRATANYQKLDGKDVFGTSGGLDNPTTNTTGTIVSGLGNLSVFLLNKGPVRPYVSAGLGAFSVGSKTIANGVETTDSKLHFGINAAAGSEFHFGRSLTAYVEARLDNIYTNDNGFSTEARDLKSIRLLPVVFGLMF